MREDTMKKVKEIFRQFAIKNGFNNKIYLDSSTFVHMPNIGGCFADSSMWAVYDTNEKGTVQNITFHCSEVLAYADLAKRFGFDFKTN